MAGQIKQKQAEMRARAEAERQQYGQQGQPAGQLYTPPPVTPNPGWNPPSPIYSDPNAAAAPPSPPPGFGKPSDQGGLKPPPPGF